MTKYQQIAYAHSRRGYIDPTGTPPDCRVMLTKGNTVYSAILTVEMVRDTDLPKDISGWHWHASVSRIVNEKPAVCNHPRHRQAALAIVEEMLRNIGAEPKYLHDARETPGIKAIHYFKALTDNEIAGLPMVN